MQFTYKVPMDIVKAVKSKFKIARGQVVRLDETKCGSYAMPIKGRGNFPIEVVRYILAGVSSIDLMPFLEIKEDGLYRNEDAAWGSYKGKKINSQFTLCGETYEVKDEDIPYTGNYEQDPSYQYYNNVEIPSVYKNLIKKNFVIQHGEVFKRITKANVTTLEEVEYYATLYNSFINHKIPVEFIEDVLADRPININILFSVVNGIRVRNEHPIWGNHTNTSIKKGSYLVANIVVPKRVGQIDKSCEFDWLEETSLYYRPEDKIKDAKPRVQYRDQKGMAIRVDNNIYTSNYIKNLLEGRIVEESAYAVLVKYGEQIFTSDHQCWGDNTFTLIDWDNPPTVNNRKVKPSDDVVFAVTRNELLEVWRTKYQDLSDRQFIYAGIQVFPMLE